MTIESCFQRLRPGRVTAAAVTAFLLIACSTPPQESVRVGAYLSRLADYGYAGTIAVRDHGQPALEAGYGLADRERRVPMPANARFDIGSLTKPFTAALVLRLEEEGVLSTEDSLGAWITEVPSDKATIRLHHLLTHTSGLVRSAASLDIAHDADREEFIVTALASDLLFEPGARFEYSDTGYDLLAAIAERATGEDWESLLDAYVLEPAGLRATGYFAERGGSEPEGTVAWSYTSPFGVPWSESREGPSHPTWYNRGSGGLVSTAPELVAWAEALWSGKILASETVARMTSGLVPVDKGRSYGYGWFVVDSERGPLVYHGGDIAGYKAHLARYEDDDLVFAILHSVAGWERVTDRYAIDAWFDAARELPPPSTDENLDAVSGTYRLDSSPLIVWTEAGRVVVEADGQPLVDALFATSAAGTAERSEDAAEVVRALERGDRSALENRLRERDRAAGMADYLLGIWAMLGERFGPVDQWEVLGTHPAQDGTHVTLLRVERADRTEVFRMIWRDDRLVSVGGDEGLRRPIALFEPVGERRAARFEPSTGRTTLLVFQPEATPASVRITTGETEVVALRDTESAIRPARRSLVRTLLPIILDDGTAAAMQAYDRFATALEGNLETGESALNDLGYAVLSLGAADEAVEVFGYVVERYPESWNAWDSLGEAQLAAGDTSAARESYAESLRLNPNNQTARQVLEATNQSEM